MKEIVQIVNSLRGILSLKPATALQIADAEQQLGVNFPDEYKEYLATFGAIMADGIELTGIAQSDHRNVITVTKKEWELNPQIPHTMYVVENTHIDGIIIWQDVHGLIYRSYPLSEAKQIASSLGDYISRRTK